MAEGSDIDDDGGTRKGFGCSSDVFNEPRVRETFLSKVYGLFGAHILAILGMVLFISESEDVQFFMAGRPALIYVSVVAPFIFLYVAYKLSDCRRTCPLDSAFLAVFTMTVGLSLGMLYALIGAQEIPIFLGLVAGVSFVLATASAMSRCEISPMTSAGLSLTLLGTATAFTAFFKPECFRTVAKMSIVAYIDTLYVVYDADRMVSPGYCYDLCPEEYIFATLNLYVDIVRFIAAVIGTLSEDNSCEEYEQAGP